VEPCVHVITLAVDDLERALTFYRDGLGLATKGWLPTGTKEARPQQPERSCHSSSTAACKGLPMTTYVLIHGAGDVGWYWHLVEAELRERRHDVVAPDLPCEEDSAGLPEYADTVIEAIGDRTDLVVVAQSLGAFTAPLVCQRVPVDLLVLVAPMIPMPKEAPADYWTTQDTRRKFTRTMTTTSPSSTRTFHLTWLPRR
jgi:pimeloyl-ACP methyl ester carboxylesterase